MLDPVAAMKHKGTLPYFNDEDRVRAFATLRSLQRHFMDVYQRSSRAPSAGGGVGHGTGTGWLMIRSGRRFQVGVRPVLS